ncbi:hypothetical protein CASFOL_035402 [Castilleja foliolosa]|uniref:F-box/LRR-repeat protein 15/At3g58940/PEG3-like LRR domain-containing protein n=1 Tax=Castilleja foliolosa TaxID=1961234 RepID=A0ABD3BSI7_9LAMI
MPRQKVLGIPRTTFFLGIYRGNPLSSVYRGLFPSNDLDTFEAASNYVSECILESAEVVGMHCGSLGNDGVAVVDRATHQGVCVFICITMYYLRWLLLTIEWPSLTELSIEHLKLEQHVMDKMLSGCPVFRFLVLIYCCGFDRLEMMSHAKEILEKIRHVKVVDLRCNYIKIGSNRKVQHTCPCRPTRVFPEPRGPGRKGITRPWGSSPHLYRFEDWSGL